MTVDGSATGSISQRAIEAVWRIESTRVLGALVRLTRDLSRAEDLAQEALVSALQKWPEQGIPNNPGAWLVTVAKNRALDEMRRTKMAVRRHAATQTVAPTTDEVGAALNEAVDNDLEDETLRLVFIACHPILSTEARIALTLRLVGGLTTEEIGRALLTPTPTIAQRIVRAKRTLSEAKVPFEVPTGTDRMDRVPAVLEVVYLIFNEGYAATRGDEWVRRELCEDALRLGRVLAAHLPNEAEVHGLVALMELQASRLRARRGPDGEPIVLAEQDRSRWDRLLIQRGLAALDLSIERARPLGPYTIQAAIAACHARACSVVQTDWDAIVALYDALVAITHSPVVELNRAVAVSMADGPMSALELVDELAQTSALEQYHLLWCVRADLLQRLERFAEASEEWNRAAQLTGNERERRLLLARAGDCKALAEARSALPQ